MYLKIDDLSPKPLCNFYPPQSLLGSKNVVCVVHSGEQSPHQLLQNIIQISGVERCLLTADVLSVKYNPTADFSVLKAEVMAEIDDFIAENNMPAEVINNASLLDTAEALADAFIRPTLNRDKGDININITSPNVMELEFTGHCAGCPYAQNTLQNIILKVFNLYLPQLDSISLKG